MIAEASIGHELTGDALEMGFGAAVAAYKAVLASKVIDSSFGLPMRLMIAELRKPRMRLKASVAKLDGYFSEPPVVGNEM